MTTFNESLTKMDQAIRLLALELPAKVHDDVMEKWKMLVSNLNEDHERNCCGEPLRRCIYERGNVEE